MRRIVLFWWVAAVVLTAALSGCGGGSNDPAQVRATLAGFIRAAGQHDYQAICTRFLAQQLLDQQRESRIPCRVALGSEFNAVQSPALMVKTVSITGSTALAAVHTTAANQPPLDGTIELVKVGGLWRILSQAEAGALPGR